MKEVEFWYDFASTYSYLSAMRIEEMAAEAGVRAVWRPFLLGPIFSAQGWSTSPFNVYPAKGRYMSRDIARIARARRLPFVMPDVFPAHSLMAARMAIGGAICGQTGDWTRRFSKAVFAAEFGEGANIADPALLKRLASGIAGNETATAIFQRIGETETKDLLRQQTERAMALGIFGAPSFVTDDGELFWGDDRLSDALIWAHQL